VRAAGECRDWLAALFRAVDRLGLDEIGRVIRGADAIEASALVRRALTVG